MLPEVMLPTAPVATMFMPSVSCTSSTCVERAKTRSIGAWMVTDSWTGKIAIMIGCLSSCFLVLFYSDYACVDCETQMRIRMKLNWLRVTVVCRCVMASMSVMCTPHMQAQDAIP